LGRPRWIAADFDFAFPVWRWLDRRQQGSFDYTSVRYVPQIGETSGFAVNQTERPPISDTRHS
jgi:hypothetical protein